MKITWLGFPLNSLIAFLCESLIVSRLALLVAAKNIRPSHPFILKRAIITLFIVTGMATLMSLYGTIIFSGVSDQTVALWLRNICYNIIAAYPLAFSEDF